MKSIDKIIDEKINNNEPISKNLWKKYNKWLDKEVESVKKLSNEIEVFVKRAEFSRKGYVEIECGETIIKLSI